MPLTKRTPSTARCPERGFAIGPLLMVLALAGISSAVLFSGSSQILVSQARTANTITAKADLSATAQTLAAKSVLSADSTLLCPPRSPHESAGTPCTAAPVGLVQFGDVPGADAGKLPSDYANAASTGSPVEVGVFTAGAGYKQLDPWGKFYIYCRWENARTPGTGTALLLITAGGDRTLQTKCGDTSAQGDDQINWLDVGAAIQRSAVWQENGGTDVTYGAAGSKVTVSADGTIQAVGLVLSGTATLNDLNLTSPLPVTSGGTGSGTAAGARTNLGSGLVGDALFITTATADARTVLGATAVGDALFTAASTPAARTTLGAGAVGDALFITTATADARTVLGATAIGDALFTAASTPAARTTLGAGAVGDALFITTATADARTVLGATAVGDALFTAASTPAARTTLGAGAVGGTLFTAADQITAWSILGLTGTTGVVLDVGISGVAGSVDAANITGGAVPIIHGGTGATTAPDALVNLGGGTTGIAVFGAADKPTALNVLGLTDGSYPTLQVNIDGAFTGATYLGATSTTTAPRRSDDATTGLFSDSATSVSVSIAGTERLRITSADATVTGDLKLPAITNAYYLAGNKILWQPASDATSLAVGPGALAAQTSTNFYNTAVGVDALVTATGSYNTAVGYRALYATTSGYGNTAVGYIAGAAVNANGFNTVIGHKAAYQAPLSYGNTIVGAAANSSSTSSGMQKSVAVGSWTFLGGYGSGNVVVGYGAGNAISSGGYNVILGYQTAETTLSSGSRNILIGTASAVTTPASNTNDWLNIGNTIYGDLANRRVLLTGATATSGTAATDGSILDLSKATGTAYSSLLLPSDTTANRPTGVNGMIRYNSDSSAVEAYQGGAWASLAGSATAGSDLYLGADATHANPRRSDDATTGLFSDTASTVSITTAGTARLRVTATGSVGIGTSAPAQKLDVAGSINLSTATGDYRIGNTTALSFPAGDANSLAAGQGALAAQTATEAWNVAVGPWALNALATANENTAVGAGALMSNATGWQNTAVGTWTLYDSVGEANTALGAAAASNITTGGYNAIVGSYVLQNAVTANSNAVLGATAMQDAENVWNNAVLGDAALYNANSAGYNVALGSNAGTSVTSGSSNVIVGPYVASTILATGSNNILIGTSSLVDAPAASTSNWLNIGNLLYGSLSAGRVGIGSATINAGASLDISQRTDSLLLPTGTTGQRPGSPAAGMLRYNSTTTAVEAYQGGAWVNFGGTATAGSSLYLGTSTAATNPSRSDDATTGLFSATATSVSISIAGTERVKATSAGFDVPNIANAYYLAGNKILSMPNSSTTNLALGYQALNTPGSGTNNSAVGYQAIYTNNGSGAGALSFNTAIGNTALYSNTGTGILTVSQNTAIGNAALYNNTGSGNGSASYNTAIGTSALYNNTGNGSNSASQNTAIGNYALYKNSGSNNLAVGAYALGNTTATITGSSNLAMGYGVGRTGITSGSNNILIGTSSAVTTPASDTNNWLNIGNTIYADMAGLHVGIGSATINAGASLDISQRTDSLLLPTGTTGQRPGSPAAGMLRYNSTTTAVEAYQGGAWVNFGGTATAGSSLYLGASTATANPYKEGDITTGLFSDSATSVSVSIAGTERLRITSADATVTGDLKLPAITNAYYLAGNKILWQPASDATSLAVGAGALAAQTATNSYNTAIGINVLTTSTGTGNTGVGYGALAANLGGRFNTAVGKGASGSNTAGWNNVALGFGALYQNTSGSTHTAIGRGALSNVLSNDGNTALGYFAGSALSTGAYNLILGINVGTNTLSSGSRNILIGTSSLVDTPAAATNDWLNIGNLLYGDMSAGRVGIGSATINAGASLDISQRTDSLLLPTGTTGQRPGSPAAGMLRYNSTTAAVEAYQGGMWVNFGGTATAGSSLYLGASTATANPYREGDVTTGLFSDSATSVSVSIAGTERLRITSADATVTGDMKLPAITNAYYLAGNKILWQPASDASNVAVGVGVLAAATGTQNTALGYYALNSSTGGYFNTAVGYRAATALADGANTIVGGSAADHSILSYGNTIIGAGANSGTGSSGMEKTTVVGGWAFYEGYGSYNAVLGYQGGAALTSGTSNVVIGYQVANTTLSTGSSNILIGTSSLVDTPSSSTSNWLNIGNLLYGDMSAGRVGIGSATINAGASLDISQRTDSLLLPTGTTGQRPGSPAAGMLRYNTTTTSVEAYQGGAWVSLGASGTGGGTVYLGTATGTTNPQRSGDATTGLFSNSATSVSVSIAGTERLRVTSVDATVTGNLKLPAITNAYYLAGNKILWQPASDTTSLAVGAGALTAQTKTGLENTAFGGDALNKTTTGYGMAAVGYASLYSNTTGYQNTALGSYALYSNTTGSNNSAFGQGALYANETGWSNMAVGLNALHDNIDGGQNAAVGVAALASTTTGENNVAVGYQALITNTGGSSNIALGTEALYSNETESNNVAIGTFAGWNVTGGSNTIIGSEVGSSTLTTGTNNILIGTSNAVDTPTSGSSNRLNIGSTIYGDLAAGKVGIGSATINATLDVNGYAKLKTNSSAPVACSATYKGSIAYTGGTTNYLCFCDGSNWKQAHSPATNCTW